MVLCSQTRQATTADLTTFSYQRRRDMYPLEDVSFALTVAEARLRGSIIGLPAS